MRVVGGKRMPGSDQLVAYVAEIHPGGVAEKTEGMDRKNWDRSDQIAIILLYSRRLNGIIMNMINYIPFWQSKGVLKHGEKYSKPFNLKGENPKLEDVFATPKQIQVIWLFTYI